MTLPANALPFGLRDVKLTPIDDAGVLGTPVDLPASRTFSFQESEDYEELRGDDVVVTSRGNGPILTWDLEAGGISLEALKVISGGTVTETGITPNLQKKLAKKGTNQRPFFKVEGQAISESGGDVHGVVYRCRAEGDIGGEFSEGAFFLTGASGRGFPNAADDLYDLIHNETAVAIT